MNKIDKMLLIMFVFLVLFIVAVLYVFVETGGNEPTVLVGGVAGAVITEIVALCRIKVGKQKREKQENSEEQNPS